MIKKLTALAILFLIIAIGVFNYKYLTLRNGLKFYFMPKKTGTFDEIYYNVTDWKFTDYAKHPKVSAFLIKKKIVDDK